VIAAPILTIVGTFIALLMSGLVATIFAHEPVFTSLWVYFKEVWKSFIEYKGFFSYPPFVIFYRSWGFMALIILTSEICAHYNKHLQPRHVPKVITWSVVIGSLLILIADWGFTELAMHDPLKYEKKKPEQVQTQGSAQNPQEQLQELPAKERPSTKGRHYTRKLPS